MFRSRYQYLCWIWIVLIHSANPQGTLKVYLDDNPVPVIDCPFPVFFLGLLYPNPGCGKCPTL